MKYTIYINQQFCLNHNLSFSEAALLSALCEAPTWATDFIDEGSVWYWVSKTKLIEELPMLGSWSNFKRIKQKLCDAGLIDYKVVFNKQLFRLTPLGKSYNKDHVGQESDTTGTEKYPSRDRIMSQQGQKSVPGVGQNNDPNKNTINPNTNTNTNTLKAEVDFSLFYDLYPKKKAKQDALKAWLKLNPSNGLLSEIITKLELQKQSHDWQKDGGKYIPNPATYINGKRWEDEIVHHEKAFKDKSATELADYWG